LEEAAAKEHKATELMLKRELSETGKHVLKMKAGALGALAGRTTGLRWMAHPVLKEFSDEPKFRMFVINSGGWPRLKRIVSFLWKGLLVLLVERRGTMKVGKKPLWWLSVLLKLSAKTWPMRPSLFATW
jgi:hypothetical protein